MADEEKTETKKKSPIMLIVGLVVLGLILAGGISYFIATKIVSDKAAIGDKPATHDPGEFVRLGDAKDGLIINIGGVNSGRYLKIGLVAEIKPNKNAPAKDGKNLSPEEIKILDTAIYTLRSQKIEDFDPAKQDHLKELLKNELNKALGEDRVYDVYITNFVLQ